MIESTANETLKTKIMLQDLPRMVWVTEFGFAQDVNHLLPAARRVFGHCVHDATASGDFHPPVIMHVPGFIWLWSQVTPDFYAESKKIIYPIRDDLAYVPRHRT
jgi:hypothetical protein